MREFKLFAAIGNADDKFIEEAAPKNKKYNSNSFKNIAAVVAVLTAISLFATFILPMFGGNSDGGVDFSGYLAYAGPILPLNAENPDGITLNRNTNFDFQPLEVSNEITISDNYTIKNNTNNDIILNASYPFISTVEEVSNLAPTIDIDGERANTTLTTIEQGSPFVGDIDLSSFNGYKDYLTDESYDTTDFTISPLFDREVIVYEVTGYSSENKEYPPATIAISFKSVDHNMVLGYGFTGGSGYEDGRSDLSFDAGNFSPKYIICFEDDITNIEVKGYKDGNTSDESNRLDGLYADYTKYTANLRDVFADVVDDYLIRHESGGALTPEIILYTLTEALTDKVKEQDIDNIEHDGLDAFFLEDYLSYCAFSSERIFYLNFEVIIPAGESVEVDTKFIKQASYNYGGMDNDGQSGYAFAPTLGSSLEFTEQSVSIENYQNIEIVSQNFGFDLENGIDEVILDLSVEEYYLNTIESDGQS